MKKMISLIVVALLIGITILPTGDALAKDKFRIGYSHYTGWMFHYYMNVMDILEKHATAEGIEIEFVHYGSYGGSLDAITTGLIDGVVMTNMDALITMASQGKGISVIIMGDYSNGNDAVLVRDGLTIQNLPGKNTVLEMNTVSHYLLARMCDQYNLFEGDFLLKNTLEADIETAFRENPDNKICVTWNPHVMALSGDMVGVQNVFDSSRIPGEIMDLMCVKTDVLKEDPRLGDALVAAWYEVMGIMTKRGKDRNEAVELMASIANCTPAAFETQLKTTAMYYTPQSALKFYESSECPEKMRLVRDFCWDHALLGETAKSVDAIGIAFPNGTVLGNPDNVQMIFDSSFTRRYIERQ